jgi:hypothetical protein
VTIINGLIFSQPISGKFNVGRVIYGLGYDANEDKIYWGDRDTDIMMRANLDGSNPEEWFTATGDPRGIVIGDLE